MARNDQHASDAHLTSKGAEPAGIPLASDGVAAKLVLVNPAKNRGAVKYLLDGREFSLNPGVSHRFDSAVRRRIEFHRGGDFGEAAYTLEHGAYRFDVTRGGWELFRQPAE